MNRDWLQISTNIAVLLGIGFLVYELNQNNLHNRSQIVAVGFELWQNYAAATIGENPAPVIAKYRAGVSEFTPEEQVVLDGYLSAVLLEREFMATMHGLGVIERAGIDPTPGFAIAFLGTPYGREWWALNRVVYPMISPVIDSALED